MKMELIRMPQFNTTDGTIGSLSVDGIFEAYTLERLDDGKNTPCLSAIPEGTYAVRLLHSEHFGRDVPHLIGVPGRSDIEMHTANYPHELKGCIAVGQTKGRGFVGNSRIAFDNLMAKLHHAADGITITIFRNRPDEIALPSTIEA